MAVDWLKIRADPIRAIEHGVAEASAINETHTGPVTYDAMEYPVGEVLPQSTTQSDGNEFTHRIFANLYFERERRQDYVDDILHPVADVIDESLAALSAETSVIRYVPTSIEDYAGELDNTLVLLVSIEFTVTTAVDLADTAPS
jgi:hypothetical protein